MLRSGLLRNYVNLISVVLRLESRLEQHFDSE